MAIHTSDDSEPSPPFTAEGIGYAFVEKYYNILYSNPENAHRFYEDSSVIGRPGPDGEMTSVTTMQGIEDKIRSLDYKECKTEIITAHVQESLWGALIVGVKGRLTGKDNVIRNFTQTFLLVEYEKHVGRYYVSNDFLYFMDNEHKPSAAVTVHDVDENTPTVPLTNDQGPAHMPNHLVQHHISSKTEEVSSNAGKSEINGSNVEGAAIPSQNDGPSYSSIVSDSVVTSVDQVPATVFVRVSPNSDQQPCASTTPKALAPPRNGAPQNVGQKNGAPQNTNLQTEAKSIYIRGLPTDIKREQVLVEFKKFGPIKRDGLQIRRYEDGFCCGFLEFESSKSACSAVEARTITFNEKVAYIEYKRSAPHAGNSRGRLPPGSDGWFRNENARGRENSVEGRSNGRHEYSNRGDTSDQPRGSFGRNGEVYQKGNQNGGGRVARRNG